MENLWKKILFSNLQEEKFENNTNIFIILENGIRPKSLYDAILANRGQSVKPEEFGYVLDENNKFKRTGRFYWSKEMDELAKWCDKNNMKYSFNIKDHPFLSDDGTLLSLKGDWTKEKRKTFPLKIKQIHVTRDIN